MTDNIDKLTEVIDGCKNGSAQSFSLFVDMYASRCYGYFYRLTGNHATSEDLLSELFVKLLSSFGSYSGNSVAQFNGWLFKIASNLFYDELRLRRRQQKLLEAKMSQTAEHAKRQTQADRQLFDKLQVNIEKLDAETAELLMMRYYSQLSFKELAEMRKEPIGTTLAKVHRGLKKLRQLMEQDND